MILYINIFGPILQNSRQLVKCQDGYSKISLSKQYACDSWTNDDTWNLLTTRGSSRNLSHRRLRDEPKEARKHRFDGFSETSPWSNDLITGTEQCCHHPLPLHIFTVFCLCHWLGFWVKTNFCSQTCLMCCVPSFRTSLYQQSCQTGWVAQTRLLYPKGKRNDVPSTSVAPEALHL